MSVHETGGKDSRSRILSIYGAEIECLPWGITAERPLPEL